MKTELILVGKTVNKVIRLNHGTTCVTILLLHLVEFILHYLLAELRIVQNLYFAPLALARGAFLLS